MSLTFSRSLYSVDAIRETAEAYGELARWTVTVDDHSVLVTMEEPSDIADLSDHFANHALHLTIASARRAIEGAQ
jgi:hypothetical protein